MIDPFADIRKAWKSVSLDLGCGYSDEPSIPNERMAGWRPPILSFQHQNWFIEFTPSPFWLGKFTVFIESHYSSKMFFDICLESTDTVEHWFSKFSGPVPSFIAQSAFHKEMVARSQPLELFACAIGIPDIDRHYEVSSHDREHATAIFSDSTVLASLTATPKANMRLVGNPTPSDPVRKDGIISMEFWSAKDRDRIERLVRLHSAILDRLQTLDYIDSAWSKL